MTRSDSIVLLVPGFPAAESETNCLPPVQNFVKALAARNPQVAIHVVAFQYPFKARTYIWNGATVHAIAGQNRGLPLRLWTWFRATRLVQELMASHNVLALHSMWMTECTYVASWIVRRGGPIHIASIQGQDALADNAFCSRLNFDRMIITAGSNKAAEAFLQTTRRNVDHVIPTGLDQDALVRCRKSSDRRIDILGVGSLVPVKNFMRFLEIVSYLRAYQPTLRCCIIGDGPERRRLDAYIKEHRLEQAVRMMGHRSREDVLDTMRESKILLHTSTYEGQGYVFLEALGAGLHVVCRDVGYIGTTHGAHPCSTNEEMFNKLRALLSSAVLPVQENVMGIDETVRAFEALYGLGTKY